MMLLLLLLVLWAPPVYALDAFLEGGAGVSQFQRTAPDGTWVQEGFGHQYHWIDIAARAGVGLRITEQWSVGVNYVHLGTVGVDTGFVADEAYDPSAHRCANHCETMQTVKTTDRLQGGELIGTYRPWSWAVSPFLRGGVAGFQHRLQWQVEGQGVNHFNGLVIAGVLGGGVCYQAWLCADVSYYKGVSTTQFPVSTAAVVPMLSVRYGF